MESPSPLVEILNLHQNEPGIFRRFFIDGDNDLTIWYDLDHHLIGFQLTIYDIAITYDKNKLKINKIDRCEKDNFAPLITDDTEIDISEVIEYLKNNNQNIEEELSTYILNALNRKKNI